jgi:shikimate dehydrogenase
MIAARRIEQAQQLADSFANYKVPITVCSLSDTERETTILHAKRLISHLSLLVNTTPLGITPNIDQSPWPENLPFPPHAAIYDLVYNPSETKLVQDARRQGLQATTGLGMLIEQAALSFEIWTGQTPSRETMRASVSQSPTLAPGASAGVSNYQSPITNMGDS